MKIKYSIIILTLFLTACSSIIWLPSQEIDKTPPISLSWNISLTGSEEVNNTGTIQTPVNTNSISIWADETKDFPLVLNGGKWDLKIDYWTWARVKVHFTSEGTKNLTAKVQTPWDIHWNIRISQIIFPDGTADGPFWKDLTYILTQSGSYQIILSANMMAWDRWSWEVDLNLEVK
jgi:hypothetical protein